MKNDYLPPQLGSEYRALLTKHGQMFTSKELALLKSTLKNYYLKVGNCIPFGHTLNDKFRIIDTLLNQIGLGKAAVLAVLLNDCLLYTSRCV